VNSATFSKNSLAISKLWPCPTFWWRYTTIRLVFSAFTRWRKWRPWCDTGFSLPTVSRFLFLVSDISAQTGPSCNLRPCKRSPTQESVSANDSGRRVYSHGVDVFHKYLLFLRFCTCHWPCVHLLQIQIYGFTTSRSTESQKSFPSHLQMLDLRFSVRRRFKSRSSGLWRRVVLL